MTTIDFDDWELSYIATSVEREINDADLKKFANIKDYKEWMISAKQLLEKTKRWLV